MWKIDKIYIIFYFLATLLEAITPVLSAYFLKIIVNVLTSSTDYSEILDTGILFIEIFIPLMVLKIYINTKILNVRSEKISDKIKWKFTLKTKQIDMSSYDNSQYYDIMVKTMNDADYRYHSVVSSFFNYVGSLITITGLFTLVLSIDYYLIISVFVYVLLLLVFTNTNNSIEYSKQMKIIPKKRFLNFANYIFKTPQFIQEEKIYNTSDIIGYKYDLYSNEKLKIIKNKNSKLFYAYQQRKP